MLSSSAPVSLRLHVDGLPPLPSSSRHASVATAFFLSIEFQQTGYLAYRLHRATFAESELRPRGVPNMFELLNDARRLGEGVVVGAVGWEQKLEQNKQALARAWVERTEVLEALPPGMRASQFVDKLFATSGVTPTNGRA